MIVQAPTLTRLWHGGCDKMFFAKNGEVQKGGSMTRIYDNDMRCNSMEFELDVWEDLHLTTSRFPALQRTYLELESYQAFIGRCQNAVKQKGSVTQLGAVSHGARGINRTKKTGNWAHGGCILGFTFRLDPVTKGPVFAMHSRVSYLSYLGGLDLALCYCMCKEIGAELGFAVEDFGFRWYCDVFQFAHMQSVAYVWNHKHMRDAIRDRKKWPDDEYPTIKLMRRTLLDFIRKHRDGFAPEQEKFAQLMRYRRRWESRVNKDGQWSSIPLADLNLEPLRRVPRVRKYREEAKAAATADSEE